MKNNTQAILFWTEGVIQGVYKANVVINKKEVLYL